MPTSSSVKTGSYKHTFLFRVFYFKNKLKILLFTNKLKYINTKVVIFQEPTQRDVCCNAGADVRITCDGVRTQRSQYVKVIPVHTTKAEEVGVQAHAFSTSALDRSEGSASGPGLLIPGEKLLVSTEHAAGWDPHVMYCTTPKISQVC
jgi:hypothetical protein